MQGATDNLAVCPSAEEWMAGDDTRWLFACQFVNQIQQFAN